MRFPTQKEIDDGFAQQQAEDYLRYIRTYGKKPADLAYLPEQDVLRPQPRVIPPPPPPPEMPKPDSATTYGCPECGRVFKYKKPGMAKMQMRRHLKRDHVSVESIVR